MGKLHLQLFMSTLLTFTLDMTIPVKAAECV